MTKKFENVETCGWSADPDVVTYGTLAEMGYLTKEYEYSYDGLYAILWTVVGDIEFTNVYGQTFKKGDTDLWEK